MENLNRIARKITFVLFAAQSLASAGFIAAATINPILGAKLASHRYLATVPAAAYLLSGAFSAPIWGVLMDRIGRRNAIASGLVLGIFGNILVLMAIQAASFPSLIVGLMMMGVTTVCMIIFFRRKGWLGGTRKGEAEEETQSGDGK